MTAGTRERLRIVVGGYIGLLPAGGITWDYLQYVLGFAALGHDVYYVEDTRLWPVYQDGATDGSDASPNVAYLARTMAAFGLADRWAYRDEASGRCFGLDESCVREICRTADVFVNLSCSTVLRDEHAHVPVRILLDSDPMFTQMQQTIETRFTPGAARMGQAIAAHTHHFTFGENVGAPDCRMPMCDVRWLPTRQPICLDRWPARPMPRRHTAPLTTVMNWAAGRRLTFEGETWGQKDVEFLRVLPLPARAPLPLAVAVGQTGGTGEHFPRAMVRRHGWRVLDPARHAADWRGYRAFIARSLGEFSVAKETYVKARTGWFSCRSACYLASGRPVVTQETGWSRYVPSGAGLFAFDDVDGAVDALQRIAAEPHVHARAARRIAEECFDGRAVLASMLSRAAA